MKTAFIHHLSLSRQTEEAIPTSTGWPLLLAGPKELAGQLGGEHGLAGDRKTEKFRCTLGRGGGVGGTQCHEVGSNQGGLPGGREMGAQRVVSQVRGRPTL